MAQPYLNVVQTTGQVSIEYAHPQVFGGATLQLLGLLQEGTFLTTEQAIPNSVLIPLLGGGSLQLTNNNRSGKMTFTTTRLGKADPATGEILGNLVPGGTPAPIVAGATDIVSALQEQQSIAAGDSIGATVTFRYDFNGVSFAIQFSNCCVETQNPLVLAGNNAATYASSLNYSRWDIL